MIKDNGAWRSLHMCRGEKRTPEQKRRVMRASIVAKKMQLCAWKDCTSQPMEIGKPYCAKHNAESRK